MKAHIVTLTIIDHDEVAGELAAIIENVRWPNHCIDPKVEAIETFDIGAWDDGHPLNHKSTDTIAWLRNRATKEPS